MQERPPTTPAKKFSALFEDPTQCLGRDGRTGQTLSMPSTNVQQLHQKTNCDFLSLEEALSTTNLDLEPKVRILFRGAIVIHGAVSVLPVAKATERQVPKARKDLGEGKENTWGAMLPDVPSSLHPSCVQ